MANILVVRSAATGDASVTNTLIDAYLAAAKAADGSLNITERDLDADPVPHVTARCRTSSSPRFLPPTCW
jgi:FMN-dependent NADH-azoreductase